ncbi:MAG: hypothetical protein ABI461_16005 [Polyangiaceae bacterium]
MRAVLGLIAGAIVVTSAFVACGSNDFTADDSVADAGDGATSTDASAADGQGMLDDGGTTDGDAAPSLGTGCSDGTREYLIDTTAFPSVAGCSGGWTIPGLGPLDTCNRDGGTGKGGSGCSAQDLCAAGWHVCVAVAEAVRNGVSACPPFTAQDLDAGEFYTSAQRSGGVAVCLDPAPDAGADDIFGCGTFGGSTGSCSAFTHYLGTFQTNLGEWSVGSDDHAEWNNVTKGPQNGGVLCCVD